MLNSLKPSLFRRPRARLIAQRGVTLVETLVGVGLTGVILTAVLLVVAKGYGASAPDGWYETQRLSAYNTAIDARAAMAYDSQAVALIAASGHKTNPDNTITSSDGTTLTVSMSGMSVAVSEPIRQNAPAPNSFVVAAGSGSGPSATPTPSGGGGTGPSGPTPTPPSSFGGGGGGSGPSSTPTPSGGTGPSSTPTPSGGGGGGGGGGGHGKPTQ